MTLRIPGNVSSWLVDRSLVTITWEHRFHRETPTMMMPRRKAAKTNRTTRSSQRLSENPTNRANPRVGPPGLRTLVRGRGKQRNRRRLCGPCAWLSRSRVTEFMEYAAAESLRFDIRELHHLAPLLGFFGNERPEIGR